MSTTKRKSRRLLAVLALCISSANGSAPTLFSIPGSVILFGRHNDVRLVTPGHTEAIKPPVELGANEGYFAYPSISPRGDLIAWGFATRVQTDRVDHKARFALGVYSSTDMKWRVFGDFDNIGATAFSQDGSQIAFVAEQLNKKSLIIFDVSKEAMTNVPPPQGLPESASLSWSRDGKQLAVEIQRGEKNPLVAVLDLDTGNVRSVGEGFNPSWSPSGEWIAYFDPAGVKCFLVHPDGTGTKMVRKVRRSTLSYRRFGWGSPVWSPDGREMLLDEMKGDGDYSDIVLLNVESGRATTKARNGLPVFGWVHHK